MYLFKIKMYLKFINSKSDQSTTLCVALAESIDFLAGKGFNINVVLAY